MEQIFRLICPWLLKTKTEGKPSAANARTQQARKTYQVMPENRASLSDIRHLKLLLISTGRLYHQSVGDSRSFRRCIPP
jgi:hypothetical protein